MRPELMKRQPQKCEYTSTAIHHCMASHMVCALASVCAPAGESYAGMYIPMLAREVVEGNLRGDKPAINIKVNAGSVCGCGRRGHGGLTTRGDHQHPLCLSLLPRQLWAVLVVGVTRCGHQHNLGVSCVCCRATL